MLSTQGIFLRVRQVANIGLGRLLIRLCNGRHGLELALEEYRDEYDGVWLMVYSFKGTSDDCYSIQVHSLRLMVYHDWYRSRCEKP